MSLVRYCLHKLRKTGNAGISIQNIFSYKMSNPGIDKWFSKKLVKLS